MKFILTEHGMIPTPIDIGAKVIGEQTKEVIKDNTKEILFAVLEALRDFLVDTIGGLALIGGGLCILFKVVGWDDGHKWAGILFLANVLIKYLLGG